MHGTILNTKTKGVNKHISALMGNTLFIINNKKYIIKHQLVMGAIKKKGNKIRLWGYCT